MTQEFTNKELNEASERLQVLALTELANPKNFSNKIFNYYKTTFKVIENPDKPVTVKSELCCTLVMGVCSLHLHEASKPFKRILYKEMSSDENKYYFIRKHEPKYSITYRSEKEMSSFKIPFNNEFPKEIQAIFSDSFTNEILISSSLHNNGNSNPALIASLCRQDLNLGYTLHRRYTNMLSVGEYISFMANKPSKDTFDNLWELTKKLYSALKDLGTSNSFSHGALTIDSVICQIDDAGTVSKVMLENFDRASIFIKDKKLLISWEEYKPPGIIGKIFSGHQLPAMIGYQGKQYFILNDHFWLPYLKQDAKIAFDMYCFFVSLFSNPRIRELYNKYGHPKFEEKIYKLFSMDQISTIWSIMGEKENIAPNKIANLVSKLKIRSSDLSEIFS